jgi:hypothetical protein
METVLRIFLALVGLTMVALIFRSPTGTATIVDSLGKFNQTTFGTFLGSGGGY